MAIDVYNDSKLLTLAAWSWPSRSLSHLHAEQQLKIHSDGDRFVEFTEFTPSSAELHYRDPTHYAEMLNILGKEERVKLQHEIKKTLCVLVCK